MAELDVQPKSGKPWWLWLLLALMALALIFFLARGCDRDGDEVETAETETTTAVTTDADGWGTINFDAPTVVYEEITDKDISVRGTDDYAIYSMDEPILFETDKSTIKNAGTDKLKQVAASMGKRFANSQVRIYGHTDSRGSAGYNKELAEERAAAVQNWLVENGDIARDRITLHPVGESDPVASNETAAGRQQNRRVEIVARRAD